jgi:addiction module HigA family antidote
MQGRPNIHPGEILVEEFLKPAGVSTEGLARNLKIPHQRVASIVEGRQPVCVDTALRLSRYFGTSDRFWLEAQLTYDLERARRAHRAIETEITPHGQAA